MDKLNEKDILKALYIIIICSTLIRIFIAATLELSVDEVYYWTYALYPDWSHFDHPPMVGFVIQFFSLNLLFDNELALRFGAIIFSIFNTFIIFSIGKSIKNPLTGLYAAFLLNASIYCSVLAGNFIIPDTPQLFFWLLSLKYLIPTLPQKTIDKNTAKKFVVACLFIGLSILSKYHGVFILGGAGLYIILFNRKWLKQPVFYIGILISLLSIVPIIIWNIQNDWISFTFHGDRVANQFVIRPDYFFTELFGQIAYNNPVNYAIIVMAIISLFRKRLKLNEDIIRILLLNSLPIWIVFTSFSIFRQTLPHWTGPAFTPLLILAAVYLSDKTENLSIPRLKMLFPTQLRYSTILMYSLLILAWLLINYYPGTIGRTASISKYGDTDFSLDMYGWKQIRTEFAKIDQKECSNNQMPLNAPIISPKYFPGTEIDYYVARPLERNVFLLGSLPNIHKYAWINESRGGLNAGDDAYMISTSNWYKDPYEYYSDYFESIVPSDTIHVKRSGKLAYFAFVYKMKGYTGNYPNPFD